jgi:hypothetical protein
LPMVNLLTRANANRENREADVYTAVHALYDLIRYIGKSKIKAEKELDHIVNKNISEYEANIQKLEAKVRDHIRMEQQFKLYSDHTNLKIVELEKTIKAHQEAEVSSMKENARLLERIQFL